MLLCMRFSQVLHLHLRIYHFLQTQSAWKSPCHTCPHYSLVSCLTECYVRLLLRTVYFAHCVTCHIICLLAWQAILCILQFHLPVLLLYHNARHFM